MTTPNRPARSPRPSAVNPLPICQRTEAEEELWWAAVATERGMTLAEFDARCGVEVEKQDE